MISKLFLPNLYAWAFILLAGCSDSGGAAFKSALESMRTAETIEFLTIEPLSVPSAEALDVADARVVLGRASLSREQYTTILDGLEAMIPDDESPALACFFPGYAIREAKPGGAVVLICLDCSRVEFAWEGNSGWTPLYNSEAPDLETYLAGLVKEFGMRTHLDQNAERPGLPATADTLVPTPDDVDRNSAAP